jgi:hypothetical protein
LCGPSKYRHLKRVWRRLKREGGVRQIESRLLRLERQPENKLPIVVVWDKKHDGSVETEIAAIRKERGEKVEICVVGWLPPAG